MDSGSITAIASEKIDRLATFTCGFDMSEVTGVEANYDERRDSLDSPEIFWSRHYHKRYRLFIVAFYDELNTFISFENMESLTLPDPGA